MTTQSIATFNFQSNSIRSFTDENQEAWFVAADVCAVLGYRNASKTIADHCKDKGITKRYTPINGIKQEVLTINEPNLYRLIIKSRKPEAEAFEAWVMEEVLPTIRKTGTYTLTINPAQQRAIQEAINDSVHRVAGRTHQGMYSAIKTRYGIAKYDQLPASKFDDCISWLNEGFAKTKSLEITPDVNKILYELCYHAFVTSYEYAKLLRMLRPFNNEGADYDMRKATDCTKQIQELLEAVQVRGAQGQPLFSRGMVNFFNGGGMTLSQSMFG